MDSVTLSPLSRSEATSPRAMLYKASFGRVRVRPRLFKRSPTRLLRVTSESSFESSTPTTHSPKQRTFPSHKHMTLHHLQLDSSLLSDSESSSVSEDEEDEEKKDNIIGTKPRDFLEELIQRYSVKGGGLLTDLASRARFMRPVDFFWYKKHGTGFIPSTREGATLTAMNQRIYLFGGECRALFNDIKFLTPDTWKWEAPASPTYGDPPPEPRSGHTCVRYANQLVVFGGGGAFNPVLKLRKCFNRIHLYDTVVNSWKTASPHGSVPSVRRNHAGALIGCTMLIYGGMDEQGNALDDLYALDLETMRWFTPRIHKTSQVRPGKRHSLSFVTVYTPPIMRHFDYDVFHLPSAHDDYFNRSTSGFYLFGGLTSRNVASNDLFVLKPKPIDPKDDDFYMKWIQPDVAGVPPEARYAYTAAMVGKYIVFCGGRNDGLKTGGLAVRDVALLNLESMRWESVSSYGLSAPSSWGCCCVSYNSQLILFGGMRTDRYCSGKIVIAETDPTIIAEQRKELQYIESVKELMGKRAFERVNKANMISRRRVFQEAGESALDTIPVSTP